MWALPAQGGETHKVVKHKSKTHHCLLHLYVQFFSMDFEGLTNIFKRVWRNDV
ncbi:unnamed protein product [Brassica rapa subsp. trilocularis]